MSSHDAAVPILESLLRIYQDSAEGYATAERDMPDLDVRRELERYRHERLKLTQQCQARLRELRAPADGEPTAPGAVHRAWMDVRAAPATNPTAALLAEMERGEDLAVDALKEALQNEHIDVVTRGLLQQHYEKVQAAHDRVKQLRDRAALARTEPRRGVTQG